MTKTIKAKAAAQERARVRLDISDRRAIATDCGLRLRSVAVAPLDVYDGAVRARREEGGLEPHGGRREIRETLFDPRAYDCNTRVDYYTLRTAA